MKSFMYFLLSMLIVVACLNPSHDNMYDPENPDKAYIGGTVYNFDGTESRAAHVALMQDTVMIDEANSDSDGWFELTDIDPGIYMIVAKASYYRALEIQPVDITAGLSVDTFDLYFQEIFYDFENINVGVSEPVGFEVRSGSWQVTEDYQEPETHSVPNVYNGAAAAGAVAITVFHKQLQSFWIDTELKVLAVSGSMWEAGMVLRYRDQDNSYLLRIGPDFLKLSRRLAGVDSILFETNAFTFQKGSYYYLGVDIDGPRIKVVLEDNQVCDVTDASITDGSVGLYVYGEANTASVNFDDVTIWP